MRGYSATFALFIVLQLDKLCPVSGLFCRTCANVQYDDDCVAAHACQTGEQCFHDVLINDNGTYYSRLGCRSSTQCFHDVLINDNGTYYSRLGCRSSTACASPAGTLVGKRDDPNLICSACCSTDVCKTKACQHTIDPCLANPCVFGLCHATGNQYSCFCDRGYTGRHCDVAHLNACASSPCVHGTCSATGSSYTCTCDPGFSGTNCDKVPPVDGHWSQWSDWSACSVTCNGTTTRMRSCDNPPPKNSGATCQGVGQDSKACAAAVSSCAEANCKAHHFTVVPVNGTSQKMCLKLSGTTNTWYNANIACRSTGNGHLVSIHSSHENDAIRDFLHGKTRDEDNCKAHSYTVVPVAGTTQKLCLNLWNSYKTWTQARQACQAVGGGDLVKIDSAAANTAVAGYLHEHHGHGHHDRLDPEGYAWIGLKGDGDHHSLHYTWTDNTAAQYNLVAGGGGVHGLGGRRRRKINVMCVLGYWGHSHEWWPNDCHARYRYLCEIPM